MSYPLNEMCVEFGKIGGKLIEAKQSGSLTLSDPTIIHMYDRLGHDMNVPIVKLDYDGKLPTGIHGFTATSSDGGAFPINVDPRHCGISAVIVNR